jgi:general secretion pathway protein F
MPAYSYQAFDSNGKTIKGVLEGDSARQIRQVLREKGLKPLEVNISSEATKNSDGSKLSGFSLSFRTTRLNTGELALFTRQLATLVQSNLPLDEALKAVSEQSQKTAVKSLILDVRSKVVEGHTLAYAMGEFPKVFNNMYRSMVQAGEHAGFLGEVLERLADYTESSQYTQQKIKMAMIYPAALVCVAFSVISALMVMVVPKLIKIFESKSTELPTLTKILIWLSDYLVNYGFYTLIIFVACIFMVRKFLTIPAQLYRFHGFLLRMPFFGNTVRTIDTARFSSTLSILIASGVPLLEAIKIAGAVLSNLVLKDVCSDVAVSVQEGSSFNKALSKTGEFPPMLVHMVASGEASGELETMLERVAKNQNRELEMTLGALMSILEPALIIFMGGFVLLIVLAVLMPIFEMNSMVG